MKNINDLLVHIKMANKPARNGEKSVPFQKRPRNYAIFVDLKKAFDSVDRQQLVNKLQKAGINSNLVMTIRQMYSKMTLKVDEEIVPTNIGVIQGGVTSPLLFNFVIDDMVR
jgi:Reverse transcriptase (RNA-dependent DNA polymerase).